MKRFALLLGIMIAVCLSHAVIGDYYSFNATTGTYTPITGTNAGITDDDALSAALPLGFSFPYGENNYTNIKICSNGWIGLGTSQTSSSYDNYIASSDLVPLIAPLWDDLSMAFGTVLYRLSGTAPNQIFTIQYTNVAWDYSSTSQFNFQVRIYQNGKIDMLYGPSIGNPSFASASIGINMLPGGPGNYFSVTPGTTATASSTSPNNAVSAYPGEGTLYEFNPIVAIPHDLSGVSLTGEDAPIIGSASVYSITVRNRGSLTQTDYQIKLFHGQAIEIGSVPGTPIQPSQNLTFTIPWTPSSVGPDSLYGRVILSGDQIPENNQTPSLNVIVQPIGVQSVTIGSGNEMARVPMDFYWQNSLFECLYFPNDLGFTNKVITSLSFYNNFTSNLPTGNTKIWLGTTYLTDLNAGWIPSTQLAQVFDGIVQYPMGSNTINIPLQNPYLYTTGTLVMMVNRPMDVTYYFTTEYFLSQTVGANRARKSTSDNTVFDPAAPPAVSTLSGQFPKTTIFYTPQTAADDPNAPVYATRLQGNYPNPFNPETTISYSLKSTEPVALGIYNIKGELVKTLVNDVKPAGNHSLIWNGKDNTGRAVSSGIYFCKLQAGKVSDTAKMILLK